MHLLRDCSVCLLSLLEALAVVEGEADAATRLIYGSGRSLVRFDESALSSSVA